MWMQDTYEGYEGKYWSLPPRKILPKPYKKPHPPMWYAAGNTSSYEMAARKGLGVLGLLGRQTLDELEPVLEGVQGRDRRTPSRSARSSTTTSWSRSRRTSPRTASDAVAGAWSTPDSTYLQSNVFRYHDTFPHPDGCPQWPELIPDATPRTIACHRSAAGR